MHGAPIDGPSRSYEAVEAAAVPDSASLEPDGGACGPAIGPNPDVVLGALAVALEAAAKAGRFDVVAQLARELEARRLASSPNVVAMPVKARVR
jgi:hypothetical protein